MMKNSPAMKLLGMVSWIVTALAAINTGLLPFEFNIFQTDFMMRMSPAVLNGIHYVIGICGLISLAMFVMWFTCHKSCSCGKEFCSCGSKSYNNQM